MLDNLVKANFVEQDGPENEHHITIFKLTDEGREAAKPPPRTPKSFGLEQPHGARRRKSPPAACRD
jgi:hypothetical protein